MIELKQRDVFQRALQEEFPLYPPGKCLKSTHILKNHAPNIS